MNEIKIIKFIAPKVISINGFPASCECDDRITCSYCVQASLVAFDKKFKHDDTIKKSLITHIKKKGIRQVAREMDSQPSSVQYWFKTENFPSWVLAKYAHCTNAHTNTQGA
jgi:hypothetical protein